MRKFTALVVAGIVCCAGAAALLAQDAQAEKTIIANERAVNEAFAKGNRAGFTAHVAGDGWAIDPMMARAGCRSPERLRSGDEGHEDFVLGHDR
jgi:hypothetical protein